MPDIQIVPTLHAMAEVYRLPREGGASSPRFKRYVDLIPGCYALAAFNPMAGPHALETTEQLIAIDAEAVARDAAIEAASRCDYRGPITLAVVLAAPGAWTDRLGTEIQHRTVQRPPSGNGVVFHWTREVPTADQIRREAIAETVRVMAVATHGPRVSVISVLQREGLAYALGGNPYGPVTAEDAQAVGDAVDVLGSSEEVGDMTAVLYGDGPAAAFGWRSAGVPDHGGYRWAIDRARRQIEELGTEAVLRGAG
jgi:hypothetical protein